jgi:hypothetical protein
MRNIIKWFGITALAAVIVFSLTTAACSGKGGGPLVGKWYDTQEEADKVAAAIAADKPVFPYKEYMDLGFSGNLPADAVIDGPVYEFRSDGKLIVTILEATYTATANTVTMNMAGGLNTADYTISGTELTLTNRTEKTGGFASGKYYKAKK